MGMNKEKQEKAYDGLVILLENELFEFDDQQTIQCAVKRKQKISNLIFYARQTNYSKPEKVDKLQKEYETKLSSIKDKFK